MFTRRRSARQKAPTLTRQLVMLAVFFGLMLTPVMSSMATAFEADRAQAFAQGDDATEPVDDGTDSGEDTGDQNLVAEEPTEVPVDTPTEAPTEAMLETGMVTVWKGECPIDNFDPYQASADQLSSTCSANGTATFQVSDTSGASPQSGPSGSSFDVLAGNVSIGEELPSGYQQPVVVCQSDMSGISQPTVSNAAVSIQVNAEEMVVCTFYNVPGDVSTLFIYKWSCPSGYDYSAMNADPKVDCTTGQDDVNFTLADTDPQTSDLQTMTGDSTQYAVMFGSIPAGQYTVTETVPDGYGDPFVWDCETTPGQNGAMATTPLATGATLNLDVPGGVEISCNWYNVPEGNEVTVYKWDCPAGTDPSGTEEYLLTECNTQHTGIPFELEDANGSHPMDSQADGTTWNNVVRGTEDVTVTETIPDGYGDPAVYCYSLLPDETDPASTTATAGSITIPDFGDNQWNYYCNWFNIPEGETHDGDTGAIEIEYRECAAGYTFQDGTNEDSLDQMLLDCAQVDGVEFTIDQGGPDGTSQLTGFYGESHVSFLEVPVGMRTVTQTVPFANTYVVCEGIVSNGGPETGVMVMPVANGSIEWNLINEEIVYCHWFVMPDGGGIGEVTIYKWDCPAGTDPMGTEEYLLTECATEHLNIPISLTDANGDYPTTTQANGTTWNDVVMGPVSITEDIPDGYGNPVVYCWSLLPDETESALVTSTGGTVTVPATSAEEWNYYCNWFNIPADMTDLMIYKWTCPDGYDPYGPGADPLMDCDAGPDGVTFNAEGPNGYTSQTDTGDSTQYAVMFGGLEPGLYSITETPPDGYTGMVWDCTEGTTYGGGADNTMTLEAMGGEVTCNWLNIPDYDHHVIVYKWICPDGTVASDHDQEWFFENCTQSTDDVQFRIDHSEGSEYAYPSGGMIDWSGVPTGPIGIQEYVPADYENPVVYCSSNDGPWEMYPVNSGYWTYDSFGSDWEGAYTFTCHVFNIYGGPGEITVYKWTCPEGYDPHAWGADPYADCVEGPNGITFTNDGPDGYSSQTDTGDSVEYAVYWGGLEPGTYTVEEMVPAGVASVFVWDCYGQRTGELRPTPLTTEPSVSLDLHAGESIICHWFNVPEDPYGKLTVIKYECSTKTWVSEVDCEVYEGGQTFDLAQWNGSAWGVIATNTTDGFGRYTWYDLEPGEYWVAEQGREWCHMTSPGLSDDGNWLNVIEDQETVVKVYNCTGEPGKPGKTPTKYPNTGVPAAAREDWRLAA